jgi:hypothetical protein
MENAEYFREYRKNNKDRLRAGYKKWLDANREQHRVNHRAYAL